MSIERETSYGGVVVRGRDVIVIVPRGRRRVLGLPKGGPNAGESPEQTAARELQEETGYGGGELVFLGSTRPNPAIQNNYCYSFLARGAYPTDLKNRLDAAEDIEIELVDESRIPHLIASEQITHGLVVAAFYFFERYRALASSSQ